VSLKDIRGEEFDEGDFIVYSTSKGLRVGRVRAIKGVTKFSGTELYRIAVEVVNDGGYTGGNLSFPKRTIDYERGFILKLNHTEVDKPVEDVVE
jgi:hypothetical protein